jgi:putative intracellular protease/amidase
MLGGAPVRSDFFVRSLRLSRLCQTSDSGLDSMGDEEGEAPAAPVPKQALIVLTSTTELPDGTPTGFWLGEATHPYFQFVASGWEVTFASVGGAALADESSLGSNLDAETKAFWEDEEKKALLEKAPKLGFTTPINEETGEPGEEVPVPTEEYVAKYDAVYIAGGYGCMWDLPACEPAVALVKAMYEAGKVVAAVCHGPILLSGIVMGDETKLLAGKECTGFTNVEEAEQGRYEIVSKESGPGSCEDTMREAGGLFKDGGLFKPNVCVAGNLMTGQNPPSAGPLAVQVCYFYDKIRGEFEPPRQALLAEREVLVGEIEAAKAAFAKELAALKKQEAAGGVADKFEMLQLKAVAQRDYRASCLADLDAKLERNAVLRQAAIDAEAAAAAAAAAEE